MADNTNETKYPQWFQEFLDAPTESLPGYFGDWLDVDTHIEETEDSVTLSGREDFEEPYKKEVTLYGDKEVRRINLALWLYQTVVTLCLGKIAKEHPEFRRQLIFCELPIRLTFSPDEAEAILGGPWKD